MANIPQQNIPLFHFLNRYCEIVTTFTDDSGAGVDVVSQGIKINQKISDNGSDGEYKEVPVTIMVPFSPSGLKQGEYKVSFLSDNLVEGEYLIEAWGYYPDKSIEGNKQTKKDKFQIYSVNSTQKYVMMLRNQVSDHLPQLYIIDPKTTFKWNDGDLFIALERSVQFWNETPPLTYAYSNYTIDNFPFFDIMLWGGEIYALNQKGILEIWNTLNITDEVAFNIDRSGKVLSLAQQFSNMWVLKIKEMKKDLIIRRTRVQGIKSIKFPLRAIRALSFIPNLSFLSTGGFY